MRNDIGIPPVSPDNDPQPPLTPAVKLGQPSLSEQSHQPIPPVPHAGDVIVNGKPIVVEPPVEHDIANETPRAHVDPREPGRHHTRRVGEATATDAIYAMPMEDRGSTFSITLSVVVIVLFVLMLLIVWWSVFRTAT
jgi:hypothetical protein